MLAALLLLVATPFVPSQGTAPKVAGLVVDESDAPVKGAKVIVEWPAGGGKRALRQTEDTGADGAFAFQADGDRSAPRVTAFADGFVFQALERAEGEALRLVGKRVLEVRFDLRRPDGTPPESAWIRFEYPEETGLSPTTAEWRSPRRRILAASARATVRITADSLELVGGEGDESLWSAAPIELDASDLPPSPIVVALEARSMVEIEVVGEGDASTGRGDGPFVCIMKSADIDEKRFSQSLWGAVRQEPQQGAADLPRKDGVRYAFDLEPGEYKVGYFRSWNELEVFESVTVTEGRTRVTLAVVDPESLGSVTVRCEDEDGRPLTATQVDYERRTGNSSMSMSLDLSDRPEDGVLRFQRSDVDPIRVGADGTQVPATSIKLTFTVPDYGVQSIELAEDQDKYVLCFLAPLKVELRAVGEGAEKYWWRLRDEGMFGGCFDLSKSRLVKLPPRQDRTVSLEWVEATEVHEWGVGANGEPQVYVEGTVIHWVDLDLSTGSGVYEVDVPVFFKLEVKAPGLKENTRLWLYRQMAGDPDARDSRGRKSERVQDGVARFESVAAGKYIVAASQWHKPIQFEVTGDTQVEYVSAEALALSPKIKDPVGGLARCGLRLGDVIVGAGGERFDSSRELTRLLRDIRKKTIAIDVERGADRIELELGPFESTDQMGGTLEAHFDE